MTRRQGLTVAIATCLAGAALVLVSAGLPWVRATSRTSTPTSERPDAFLETTVSYSARDAAPAASPLGLLALAGVAALAGSRGRGRQVVGVVLLATGAGIVATAARVVVAPRAVVVAPVTSTAVKAGPWFAIVGGAGVAAAGVGAARRGRRWSALGGAYDAPDDTGRRAPSSDTDDLGATWNAVERGEDED